MARPSVALFTGSRAPGNLRRNWSGRRESNPRMQLGKLDASQSTQELSCKTRTKSAPGDQSLTSGKQNSQPLGSLGFHDNAAAPFEARLFDEKLAVIAGSVKPCSGRPSITSHSTAPSAAAGTQSSDSSQGVAPDSPRSQMRPLDAPKVANRNESAQDYSRIVAVLNAKWRVVECRDRVQWVLQSCDTREGLRSGVWRGRNYCRTKEALLRVCAAHAGELDPTAVGLLAELPDRIEAPGLPSRSTPTFGAPEKVP